MANANLNIPRPHPLLLDDSDDEEDRNGNLIIQQERQDARREVERLAAELLAMKIKMYEKIFEHEEFKQGVASDVFWYRVMRRRITNEDICECFYEPAEVIPLPQDVSLEMSGNQALRNDLILDIIGSYLSNADLRKARLVNKYWSEAFNQQISRRKPLLISSPECPAADDLIRRKARGDNVHISILVLLNTPLTSPVVTNIAKAFGSTISGLVIDNCAQTGRLMSALMAQMTSLEYIDVRRSNTEPTPINYNGSMLDHVINITPYIFTKVKVLHWEDVRTIKNLIFLQATFPVLRTLRIDFTDHSGNGLYQYSANLWTTLEELSISAPSKGSLSSIMTAFGKTKPKLRKLKISNLGRNVRDLKSIATFMKNTCAQSLEGIKLSKKTNLVHAASPMSYRMFTVPYPNLETIKYDFSLSDMIRLAQDFAPNLTTIDASECSMQCWFDFFCGITRGCVSDKPNLKVTCLRLGYVEAVSLKTFSKIFPNLTVLDVPRNDISKEAMQIIFRDFPKLKNLKIRKGIKENVSTSYGHVAIGDSTMLGIEDAVFEKILANKEPVTSEELQRVRTLPYIGDLKALESFSLETHDIYSPSELFLRHGLQNLPRLKTVQLPVLSSPEDPAEPKIDLIREVFKDKDPVETIEKTTFCHFIKLEWPNPCKLGNCEILNHTGKKV